MNSSSSSIKQESVPVEDSVSEELSTQRSTHKPGNCSKENGTIEEFREQLNKLRRNKKARERTKWKRHMRRVERETNLPCDPNKSKVTVSDTKAVKRPVVNNSADIGEPKKKRKRNKKKKGTNQAGSASENNISEKQE